MTRLKISWALSLSMAAAAGAGEVAAPSGGDAAPAQAERATADRSGEELRPVTAMRPTLFQKYRRLYHDGSQKPDDGGDLVLRLQYAPGITPVGISDVKLEEVMSDAGPIAPAPSRSQPPPRRYLPEQRGTIPSMIWLYLTLPPDEATVLTRVRGRFTVALGSGPLRTVVLGKFGELLNRNVKVEGLERPITVEIRARDKRFALHMHHPNDDFVAGIRFLQPDGATEVMLRTHSVAYGPTCKLHWYTGDVPDDGLVELTTFSRIHRHVVPFTIENLPLPRPTGPEPEPLIVPAQPAPDEPRS